MNAALALPPIPLSALPERTKDFIIGVCNDSDLPPEEAVRRILNNAAAPFMPPSGPVASVPALDGDAPHKAA